MTISLSDLKVLIVDDNKFMVNLVRRILKELEIDLVQSANDGVGALERLDETAIDVVLCDLNMPGMDGIEFLRHLAGREAKPAVILMSGEGKSVLKTVEQLGRAHRLSILGSIPKPVTKDSLEVLLEKVRTDQTRRSGSATEPLTPAEIRAGLEGDAVVPYFQPKVSVADRALVGVETLVRWQHAERGLLGPWAVIPGAEEFDLINDVTEAVLQKAMAQTGAWRAKGLDVKVSVNVSVKDLYRFDFPDFVVATAEAEGVDPSSLMLEVTESRIMADIAAPLEILTRLRMKGVELSIDDYGTGASTIQQLKRIPFTELKIDREFVFGSVDDADLRAILTSCVTLGKDLGLSVVAEGVETQDEWNLMGDLGVDIVQGYFIAKPMAADDFDDWLADWSAKSG